MKKQLLLFIIALSMINVSVMAQSITGKVTSAVDGQPLPGVSILVKGTNTGALTNSDGKYTISTNNKSTLVFSYIGFKSQEVALNGRSTVDVALAEDASQLQEVVVTALGISKEQRALGYATSSVKAEAIARTGSPTISGALYGKAPGVMIATAPGGATSGVNITIRGLNSITGKSNPLIVVDGIPIRDGEFNNTSYWSDPRIRGNGLLDINPEDIEDVTILKGASAAALYGSEAVNGVVLITSKSGKGKKNAGLGIDFNMNYSVDKIAYLPRYQYERGTGAPLQLSPTSGVGPDGFIYYDTNGDGVKETRGVANVHYSFGPKFDGKPVMAWDGVIRPYEAQVGHYQGLFQDAQSNNVNLAVSKATDNMNIRFSLTRQENEGISIDSKNIKNIANLNSTFKLGKKWSTDLMVNYINQNTHNRPYSVDRMINNFTGMMSIFDNAEWYKNKYQTSLGYRFVTGATGQSFTPNENIIYNGFKADIADYVWRLYKHSSDELSNRVIASMTHHLQITDDLKLRVRTSTDFTNLAITNKAATERPLAYGYSGGFGLGNTNYNILYGDALLTYTKKITPDFSFSAMAGYTAHKETATTLSRSANGGLSTENLFDIAASVNVANSSSSRSSLIKDALLGTLNFDYKNFLFVEGTIRRDRTSTMHPDNNTFIYPSVNSGFVFTDAFKLPNFLSYGKLRASWGIVGNYPGIYGANIAYNQSTLGVQQVGGQPVLFTNIPGSFGNDLIRPERKYEYEFGLDTKLFNNKINLDVSYYNAQVRDQILGLTLPASSGAGSILTNIGTLRNTGLEVSIGATPFKKAGFMWETTLNVAKNWNTVEKLANNSTQLQHADYDGAAARLISVVGQPMGDIYTPTVAVNAAGEKIVNANGLYQLNPTMSKVGNAMPKMIGSFINTLSYKNFSVNAVADFRYGGHVMPTGLYWMVSRGLLEESLNGMDAERGGLKYYRDAAGKGIATTADKGPNGEIVYNDGVMLSGVLATGEKNTNIISQAYYYAATYNWGGPQYGSSRYELYVNENSYLKMRELSLSYKLPLAIANKLKAKNLTMSVFGRNLFYFYRTIKDIDAEQTTAGSRWTQNITNLGSNPSTRTMGVMLRASF